MKPWKSVPCAVLWLAAACGGRAARPAEAAAVAPRVAESREALVWRGRVAEGGEINVHIVHGAVRAEASSGEDAEVDARDGACAIHVHPDERRVRVTAAAGEVELLVRVPAGVRLVVHAVNAPVNASGIREVDARVVNGGIEIAHASRVRARSVNGPIKATLDTPDASVLSTVNGDIDVAVPVGTDLDLDARSATGQVALGVPIDGSIGPKSVHGAIGRGGHTLRVKSVTGKISVGTPK